MTEFGSVEELLDVMGIDEELKYFEPEEKFNSALIGVSHDGCHLIYDHARMTEMFMADGMTREDAEEWIEYNVIRTIPYMGENHPIICTSVE